MKLRQLPEDFKVEEINGLKPSKDKGNYKLYLLEKKSLETFSLLGYLSKQNRIPIFEFGIAGLKDRHAVTKQYFTTPSKYGIKTFHEKNFRITFLGYVNQPLKLGDLEGNRFEITVRDVKKNGLEGVYLKAKTLSQIGTPNYFDSQRFGSVINNKFVAKHLIKKEYEQAVKVYLTSFSKFESRRIKEEKKSILENWDSIKNLDIKTKRLADVIKKYRETNNWLEAYEQIPANIREMMISAYQSYLWNECVKELLIKTVSKRSLYTIKYGIGKLVFYKKLSEEEIKRIPFTFKTISETIKPTSLEKEIINKVLSKEGVAVEEFNIKLTGNFFKTHERKTLLKPEGFKISQQFVDELNDRGRKNVFKTLLTFTLPKGSYATVITKRLFNQ